VYSIQFPDFITGKQTAKMPNRITVASISNSPSDMVSVIRRRRRFWHATLTIA